MTYINVYHDDGFECLEEEILESPVTYSWEYVILNRLAIVEEIANRLEDEEEVDQNDIIFNFYDIIANVISEIIGEVEDTLEGDHL